MTKAKERYFKITLRGKKCGVVDEPLDIAIGTRRGVYAVLDALDDALQSSQSLSLSHIRSYIKSYLGRSDYPPYKKAHVEMCLKRKYIREITKTEHVLLTLRGQTHG